MVMAMNLDKNLKKKILALNLARYLNEKRLSQKTLANRLGMAPQQLSFYMKEHREPSEGNKLKFAQEMGLENIWELYRMPPGIQPKPI